MADKKLEKYHLSTSDWKALEITVALLEVDLNLHNVVRRILLPRILVFLIDDIFTQPFKDITVFLSSEKFPTISYCSLMFNTIFTHLETYDIEAKKKVGGSSTTSAEGLKPVWIRNAALAAKEKLEKYYTTADTLPYVIGTGTM